MPCSKWLRLGFCSALVLAIILSSGCSIHPLPGDIPRVATTDIVERIRCEVQEGLKQFPQDDPLIKSIVAGTTIGYDFNFNITEEDNANNGSLTFQNQGHLKDNFTLNLTGQATKTRANQRRFRIMEDLATLYKVNCSPEYVRANWVYPITGATGLGEVVRTFIKLESWADLKASNTQPLTGVSNVVFSDVLTFMTTLDVTATPTLTLTPVVRRFMLTNASVTGEAKRTDTHTLIVALARDPVKVVSGRVIKVSPSARLTAQRAESQSLVERGVIRDSREVRTLVQKDSDAYTRVLIELQRILDLEDDDREAPRLLGEKILEVLRTP